MANHQTVTLVLVPVYIVIVPPEVAVTLALISVVVATFTQALLTLVSPVSTLTVEAKVVAPCLSVYSTALLASDAVQYSLFAWIYPSLTILSRMYVMVKLKFKFSLRRFLGVSKMGRLGRATISSKYLISLPKSVVTFFDLKIGDKVDFYYAEDQELDKAPVDEIIVMWIRRSK